MKKNTIISLKIASAATLLALALPALAETSTTRPELNKNFQDQRMEFRTDAKNQIDSLKTTIQGNKEAFRQEAKDMRASSSTPEEIRERRQAMIAENKNLREGVRADLKSKREAMRADIKKQILDFKASNKVKLDETKKEKLHEILGRAFGKLSAQIAALENFDQRVGDKIDQEKAKGSDVSAAESALNTAENALDDATVAVSAVNAALSEAIGGATEISKEAVTAAIQKAVDAIKNAREKYRAVLNALPKDEGAVNTTGATN